MDIGITWDPVRFRGDWDVTSGDLAIDPGGLRSAVLLSLFTDRAAPPDWQPPAATPWERRGHWSDTYETEPLGSWLWLLNRAKKYNGRALLNQAADYAVRSLAWLKNTGIVETITVDTSWQSADVMQITVTLTQPKSPQQTFQFGWAWQGV